MTATGTPPPELGARTWKESGRTGSPASLRSELAAGVVVASALRLVAVAAPSTTGWVAAMVVALVVGIGVALVSEPIALFDKVPGIVVAAIVGVSSTVGLGVLAAVAGGVVIPFGIVLVAAAFALGLDWRRVERLQAVLATSGAVVLLTALGDPGLRYLLAAGWMAAAFGTFALLEGDRRAALPRVQPDAREAAASPAASDLATALLVALAVGLVAALVLSVPACERRLDGRVGGGSGLGQVGSGGSGQGPGSGSGGGSGSGQGSGSGRGSGAAGDHRYVPDPDGRYLVPNGGAPSSDGTGRVIPTPETVPSLGDGEVQVDRDADGGSTTYRRTPDGDIEVVQRSPEGEVSRWRLHERPDGLTQIDELDEDGDVVDTWYFDPEGQVVDGQTADGQETGDQQTTPPDEPKEQAKPSWATLLRVLGVLLLVAAVVAALAWWWRRRHPAEPGALEQTAPPWALALARRIEGEGAARGRPRAPGESVVAYGRALTDGALPDPRLARVAEVVSDALFSGRDPGPSAQGWAEATFAQVLDDHPVPSRRERRGARAREEEQVGS
ncbi:MAG: hypothetical protein R2701_08080 [Acidimicrobiales bacterium]